MEKKILTQRIYEYYYDKQNKVIKKKAYDATKYVESDGREVYMLEPGYGVYIEALDNMRDYGMCSHVYLSEENDTKAIDFISGIIRTRAFKKYEEAEKLMKLALSFYETGVY